MRKFSQIEENEMVKDEHIFCIGMVMQGEPWIVCRWCQQFKEDVKDKPCRGPMKVNLN